MKNLDLETLKHIQFVFQIYSDHSCQTLGYKRLCEIIEECEKADAEYESPVEKLEKFFKSEEGEKSIKRFAETIRFEEEIRARHLERIHNKFPYEWQFVEFVEKVIAKYESNKYKDFWYNKSCEPPTPLYFLLYEYAEKYGRECTQEEIKEYGSHFSSELYFINNYYFNLINGQGSIVEIIRKK